MTARQPYIPWFPADWLRDADLARCSLAAQGAWIRMICLLHSSEEYGVFISGNEPWPIEDVAAAVGGDKDAALTCVSELLAKGVARKNNRGAIFCRRMVEDEELRRKDRDRKRTSRAGTHPSPRPPPVRDVSVHSSYSTASDGLINPREAEGPTAICRIGPPEPPDPIPFTTLPDRPPDCIPDAPWLPPVIVALDSWSRAVRGGKAFSPHLDHTNEAQTVIAGLRGMAAGPDVQNLVPYECFVRAIQSLAAAGTAWNGARWVLKCIESRLQNWRDNGFPVNHAPGSATTAGHHSVRRASARASEFSETINLPLEGVSYCDPIDEHSTDDRTDSGNDGRANVG